MTFPYQTLTSSPEATERTGEMLAENIINLTCLPRFIALYGDLGCGKTAFARGFVRRIFPLSSVKSPTFTLVNEYAKKGPQNICTVNAVCGLDEIKKIAHFDMYRIESEDDIYSTGFYDFLEDAKIICIAEWCEKIPYALPENYIKVVIEKTENENPNERKIYIENI